MRVGFLSKKPSQKMKKAGAWLAEARAELPNPHGGLAFSLPSDQSIAAPSWASRRPPQSDTEAETLFSLAAARQPVTRAAPMTQGQFQVGDGRGAAIDVTKAKRRCQFLTTDLEYSDETPQAIRATLFPDEADDTLVGQARPF